MDEAPNTENTMNASPMLRKLAMTTLAGLLVTTALAGPEIKVSMLQPGQVTEIADGGLADFPEIAVGDTQAVFFSVENVGDEDLEFDAIPMELSGALSGFFILNSLNGFAVPPGFSTTFRILHEPPDDNTRTARVFIFSNATNTLGPFDLTLRGKGIAQDLPEDNNNDQNVDDNDVEDDPNAAPDDPQADVDNLDPNQIVDTEDENVADTLDPNEIVDNADDQETETNQDPNEVAADVDQRNPDDQQEETDIEDPLNGVQPLLPNCGFGVGFASMMCMLSLCGARAGRRMTKAL